MILVQTISSILIFLYFCFRNIVSMLMMMMMMQLPPPLLGMVDKTGQKKLVQRHRRRESEREAEKTFCNNLYC
jgi:hypothetical protein